MFKIKSDFIGNFKLGDNINYNLKILAYLYKNLESADVAEKKLLYKPITIFLISIIEAILYDFHYRIRKFTSEGVRNIAQDVLNYIRGKGERLDELDKYIKSAEKHNLFDVEDGEFYEILNNLRKLRNRIHIQNVKFYFEADEKNAFNKERKEGAEKTLEKILRVMSQKYARGKFQSGYVTDFELPWNPYFDQS